MEPCKIRSTPQRLVPPTGARRQGNTFSFQQREKNVLAISSYRSAHFTSYFCGVSALGTLFFVPGIFTAVLSSGKAKLLKAWACNPLWPPSCCRHDRSFPMHPYN